MKVLQDRKTLIALVIFCMGMLFAGGIGIGRWIEAREASGGRESHVVVTESGEAFNMDAFWKVNQVLHEKFMATGASSTVPTSEKKVFAAIEGLTTAYQDPYTVFFPPKETKQFEDEVRGDFGGIGAEIGLKEEALIVVAPLKNTPAERAGLKSGDVILKIDKKFTGGMNVEDAVALIRGPRGTQVTLTIKQNGDAKDVTIERDTIMIPTIDTKLRDDGVFVISLYSFSATAPELFRNALREFIVSGSDKLVLDLRNNPGGYLGAAVDMASWFLPPGKPVVIEDSGAKAKQKISRSLGYNIFTDKLKMAVLINGGSASASEILAGALREHGVAKLLGEKSFGKGSVQELVEITPDTSLKVTVARWLTPLGHSISENGLTPDIKIENTKDDAKKKYDRQMERAAEILKDPNFKR